MTGSMIAVRNLRKVYRVYAHPSQMIGEVLTGRMRHREFLALDDISFDVHPGSVVGLLGRNGAGKSTLLRIIARTLDATGGTVSSRGRISAILELGTGFHGDYTGRENIYFGGICLGLGRREMHERVDEIIAFSELEDFIDQPFRTYSSGMQARLTFSVATCVDPDILIVDEALAVGDAKFQLKSFDRIREFKRRGKAILLVSHSINQITAFCDHAILLDHGRMLAQGDPNRVGNIYHELLFGPEKGLMVASAAAELASLPVDAASTANPTGQEVEGEQIPPPALAAAANGALQTAEAHDPEGLAPVGSADEAAIRPPASITPISGDSSRDSPIEGPGIATASAAELQIDLLAAIDASTSLKEHRYGTGAAKIVAAEIRDLQGRIRTRLRSLESYEICWTIEVYQPISSLCYGILLRDARGLELFGADSYHLSNLSLGPQERGTRITAKTRFQANLAGGRYFLTLALANPDQTKYDLRFDAIELLVEQTRGVHDSSLVNLAAEFELGAPVQSSHLTADSLPDATVNRLTRRA